MTSPIRTSLDPAQTSEIIGALSRANQEFSKRYPGESDRRQPVQTVYGGAHLFEADSVKKLGDVALRTLNKYAPNPTTLMSALGVSPPGELATKIYRRIVEKLQREPVEDFRLDFEDGYGNRADEEEDGHAASSALEVARGMHQNTLPPFIGIRLKPLNEDLRARSIRTLDVFVTTLAGETSAALPDNFVITVPKVQLPQQVAAAVRLFEALENKTGLPRGSLRIELMIETPQSIINERGEIALHSLVGAADGRCGSIHFGVYDYTAACGITADYQKMGHPACDFARQLMLVAMSGTGIQLSDGATNILPVGPHRPTNDQPLTAEQEQENREVVHQAWRLAFQDNMHSLRTGFYQGWDLHPAQFVARYAAVYLFFLQSLER